MASFQFDSGRSHVFGDIFAGRQAPIGPSDSNSALLDRREWPSLEISVPELESDFPAYASEAVEVRNTFIHVASPTAEADHADRPLLSCPANIGWIEDLLEDRKDPPPTPPAPPAHPPPPMLTQKEEFSRPVIRLENALEAQTAAAQADAGLQVPQVPLSMGRSQGTGRALGVIGDQRGRGQSTYMLPTAYPSTAYPSGGDMPVGRSHMVGAIGPVASVQAAPAPAPGPFSMGQASSSLGPHAPKPHGTKELPSVGSAGHALGTCRPCAFLYAKGCFNGAACSFCHLCDRGEKKRRQKQKKAWFKGGA